MTAADVVDVIWFILAGLGAICLVVILWLGRG
jgi:hypothetical protein